MWLASVALIPAYIAKKYWLFARCARLCLFTKPFMVWFIITCPTSYINALLPGPSAQSIGCFWLSCALDLNLGEVMHSLCFPQTVEQHSPHSQICSFIESKLICTNWHLSVWFAHCVSCAPMFSTFLSIQFFVLYKCIWIKLRCPYFMHQCKHIMPYHHRCWILNSCW